MGGVSNPVRTCVGCRGRADKHDLVRIVRWGDGLLADPSQTAPGRGAYLHPDQGCVESAIKRKALTRALRLAGRGPDPAAVRAALAPHLATVR